MSDYTLKAEIGGDDSGLQGALRSAMHGLEEWGLNAEKLTEEGSKFFKSMGINVDQFAAKLGTSAPMLLGIAAAGVAITELGKEVFEVGKEFDEAFAKIGKATGAVGPQLQELGDDLVKVMGSGVVQNLEDVAGGFTLLTQKLDVTGEELVKLTHEFSEFADVNNTTVTESVKSITQVMNEWNIETEKAGILMDQLTRSAQLTGEPVSRITAAVQNSSAQFKQLGFSLTDSIGFLTAFSKAGADMDVTTRALNTAVVKLSAAGGDVAGNFREAIAAIQSARSPQEALNDATELFGSRSAPKMVDALRNARFDLQGFTTAIQEAQGTLEKTSAGTESLSDKWAAFGNRAMASVEPLGEVLVGIGKILVDFGNKAFEVLNNIISPLLNLIRDEFRDISNVVQSMVGLTAALLHGDWKTAWAEAQLIVLNVVKMILDLFSAMANQVIGIINNMTGALRDALNAVGVHVKALGNISLAEMTGVADAIKKINEELGRQGEKTTQELGAQSLAREKIINDEAKDYEISIEARIKAAKELQETYQTQQQAERSLTALTARTAAESTAAAKTFQQNAALVSGAINTMVAGPFQALGDALAKGENAWQAFSRAAVHAIGQVVKAFGDQMAAKAALDLAQAIAYSSNPFTAPAAPGYYAQAGIEAAAATAAYTAAGALSAFERGTAYSAAGYAMVGERGPELVRLPQGASVQNQQQMAGTGREAPVIHMHIGEVRRDSVGALSRQIKSVARQLAFEGVL